MKRIFKIVLWSVFFGVLIIFAIALAMNGFSIEKLTQSIKGTPTELSSGANASGTAEDFNDLVDEFLATELENLSGAQATGMQSSGTIESGAVTTDFPSEDFVADDIRNDKERLYQMRLEYYQAWRKETFGEDSSVSDDELSGASHSSPTELDETELDMFKSMDTNIQDQQEAAQEAEDEAHGSNDLPDIEFGPIESVQG